MKTLLYGSFLLDIIKRKILFQNIPLVVGFNVTNRCNLDCTYCYGDYANRVIKDFTKEQLFELIEKLSKMGTRLIHIGGGEPLIRDDIGQIIDKVKLKNMLCFMNTNGMLVPLRVKEIRKLDGLTISLDGDEKSNDINRGQGSFKKILKAIEIANTEGVPVSTNTVINKNNLDSLDTVISLAQTLNFTAEFNLPYEHTLGNRDNPSVHLSDDEIRMVLKKLIYYEKKGAPLSFSINTRKYALSWPLSYNYKIMYDTPPNGFKIINCYMGRFMCLVDSDGSVYPCGQLLGRFPALNIHNTNFKECWENLSKKRTCKTCYCMCFTEFNQLFSLKPAMLFSTAIRFLKKSGRKKNDFNKRSGQ